VSKLLQEIKDDIAFVKSQTLQPKWYKFVKVFILIGVVAGYVYFFGWTKTIVFFAVFLFLSLLVHLLYRARTNKWTRSWLDFVVVEGKPKNIGIYYYGAVLINAAISVIISQVIP
jgi:hypothetical protein